MTSATAAKMILKFLKTQLQNIGSINGRQRVARERVLCV